MKKKSMITVLLPLIILMIFTACNNCSEEPYYPVSAEIADETESAPEPRTVTDRAGRLVELPDVINTIATLGASNTEIAAELGFAGHIVAMDTFSADVYGVSSITTLIDLWNMDIEALLVLNPDVIIAASDLFFDNTLELLTQAGTAVVYIPTATTIDDILLDISFIGYVLGAETAASELITDTANRIEHLRRVASEITTPLLVYFEIETPPFMFTFGRGTFLNEMLELIGAVNIFADYGEWVSISDEQVLAANPDVILTNVGWMDNHLEEMQSRQGWQGLCAITNNQVFVIDTNASSRPTHNIVTALEQMARAIYPEYFEPHFMPPLVRR